MMDEPVKKRNGVFVMMCVLFVTKILGFLKLRTIAHFFGTSPELDIFWAAFTIPDMLFMVMIAGSVNAAIIPMISEVFYKKGKEELDKFFNRLSLIITLVCVIIAILLFIFTPQLTTLIIQSDLIQKFLNISQRLNSGDIELFVSLTRIMLLSPIILGISTMITAYLQVYKEFFVTSLAPLFYNIAMMFFPIFFVGILGMGVEGVAISAVLGSLLHFLIQIPLFKKYYKGIYGVGIQTFKEAIKDINILKALKLAIPRIIGIFGEQINVVVDTLISFSLASGALSAYKFAFSLHLFPINIVGSALAQVALPDLAKYSDKEHKESFSKIFNASIQLALYLVLPIVGLLLVLRLPFVRLSFGSGAFDWDATRITSWCLALLTISVVAQTLSQIILRAFYAIKETWLPLVAILIGIILNILLAYFLTNFFSHYSDWRDIVEQMFVQISHVDGNGFFTVFKSFISDFIRWCSTKGDSDMAVGGLSLAMSIAYFVEVIALCILLNIKTKVITWKETFKPMLLKLLNLAIMVVGMYCIFRLFDFKLDTSRTFYVIVLTVVTTIYGVLSYWIGSKVFGISEVKLIEDKIVNIFKGVFKWKK